MLLFEIINNLFVVIVITALKLEANNVNKY